MRLYAKRAGECDSERLLLRDATGASGHRSILCPFGGERGDISGESASGGAVIHFIITQDGSYTLCDGDCAQTSSAIYLHGGLASWHGDALVANTIAIKVSPDHSTLTVFVNDQQVATVATQFGPRPAIALGALAGSEAIFTHATLYTGQ